MYNSCYIRPQADGNLSQYFLIWYTKFLLGFISKAQNRLSAISLSVIEHRNLHKTYRIEDIVDEVDLRLLIYTLSVCGRLLVGIAGVDGGIIESKLEKSRQIRKRRA